MGCKMQGLFLRDFVRRYVVFVLVSEWCVLPCRCACVCDMITQSANACQPEPRKCMNAAWKSDMVGVCAGQSKAGAKRKARSCPSVRGLGKFGWCINLSTIRFN